MIGSHIYKQLIKQITTKTVCLSTVLTNYVKRSLAVHIK